MKAVQLQSPGGLSNLQIVDVDDPGEPSAHEIRVKLHASSLNGHDHNVALGVLPVQDGRIILTDGAGVVEMKGKEVKQFAVGDRVISTFFPDWQDGEATSAGFASTPGDGLDGYAAEVVVRPATSFTHAPNLWSLIEGATLPTAGLTAWRALVTEGELRAGQSVLILGTGGVSVLALQLAKQLGAKVIITSSSDEKLERARALGADVGVNYRKNSNWANEVLEVTDGRGVDLTLETSGPGTLPESIKATRIGGRIILIGVLTGIGGSIPTVAIMGKHQRIQGITVGSHRHQVEMVAALNKMNFRPSIDATYSLETIADAFLFQESGNHFGKICITI
jgi:NADPH:quinone reductase-like Zn-dependent oxidoreductase